MNADAIRFYIDRPCDFVKDIIGADPDPVQADILNAVAANSRVSVRSGHGIGKTTVEAWTLLWFLFTRPHCKVPCTAPTKHQLSDILWSEAAKWLSRSKILRNTLVWTAEKIYMRGNLSSWFAVARTATNPEALQGFHDEHLLFIIDEGSGVSDKVFEPVMGTLTTKDAKLLICGNPTRTVGFFYDSHNSQRDRYKTLHASSIDSVRVDPQYINDIAGMWGQDSDVFRVRVLGEFPKGGVDSFILLDWCETVVRQEPTPEPMIRIDIGVDVARFGDDESVIAIMHDKTYTRPLITFRKNDTMELTGHIVNIAEEYLRDTLASGRMLPVHIKIDCDGLGVGVYDRLKEVQESGGKLDPEFVKLYECHFGGAGGTAHKGDPVEFHNSTGIMWGQLREGLRCQALEIPEDETLIKQLSNRRYSITSLGALALERKEDMKKRGVDSPDRADALALAYYEPPVRGEFVHVSGL